MRTDRAAYQMTFSDATGLAPQQNVWLHGSNGTVQVDLVSRRVRFGARDDSSLKDVTAQVKSERGWAVEQDFVEAIRGERTVTLTDFETATHYMHFTDAVWQSMKDRREVIVK